MKKLLLLSVLMFSSLCYALSEPYRSVKILPFDNHGWFSNQNQLEAIFKNKKIKTVIEVGSWLGCSTRFLASKLPSNGKLYAVDTWAGSPNEIEHTNDPRLPYLYEQFLSNIIHAGLTEKVIPIRMTSFTAASYLRTKADLIYIDAAHDTNSVIEDITIWYPHLRPNGIFCGDDWTWESVRKAVETMAIILNKKIGYEGNFWWYE